jgi:hypothetical protein
VRFVSTASISDCIAARQAACFSASAKDRGSPSSHVRCNSPAKMRDAGEGTVGAGVRGDGELAGARVVARWRGGEELVVAGAGERGVVVITDLGAGVGLLEEGSPTPPAPLKWTYSMVKSSYVGVVPSSTALSQAHPLPSSNTTSRTVRTHSVPGSRML